MKLAFAKNFYDVRDDEKEIKSLPVEYEPTSWNDACTYIKNHRVSPYFSINFMEDLEVVQVDYGSHTEFCYVWDLNSDQKKDFLRTPDEADHNEDAEKARFAAEILDRIKNINSIPYDVAVAFSKILGDI